MIDVWSGQINARNAGIPPDLAKVRAGGLQWLTLFGGQSDTPKPRVLMLGMEPSRPEARDLPRVLGTRNEYYGGFTSEEWGGDGTWCAPIEVVYGAGAGHQRFYADWRVGTYQLPPCTHVAVSVAPYGWRWGDGDVDYNFAGACVPGVFEGAHPFMYSGSVRIDPNVNLGSAARTKAKCPVPPHARSAEVMIDDTAYDDKFKVGPVLVRGSGGHTRSLAQVDANSPGVVFPVEPGRRLELVNLTDPNAFSSSYADITVRFYIAP